MFAVTSVLFGNCAAEHPVNTASNSSSQVTQSFSSCSLTGPENLFQLTYYPFAQKNCASCHVEGGAEASFPFASNGLEVAYTTFSQIGYTLFDTYATNGHSPTATTANQAIINDLQNQWLQGLNELSVCSQGPVPVFINDQYASTRVYSKSKAITPSVKRDNAGALNVVTPSVIQWDLNKDMLAPPAGVTWPSMPGAIFQLTVTPVPNGTNTYYMLSQPKIVYPTGNSTAVDLQINSIILKLNGQTVNNETTFTFVSAQARKNTSTLLASGGMVSVGSIRTSDVVSFSIGAISVIALPPPPPTPDVTFSVATSTVSQTLGKATLTVNLNQTLDQNVVLHFSYDPANTTAKPNCCATIVDARPNADPQNPTVQVLNYDREFAMPTSCTGTMGSATYDCTLIFPPRVTTQTFDVTLFNDLRQKPSRKITLKLKQVQVGAQAVTSLVASGANTYTHTLTVTNTNPAPAAGEVTFSNLMGPGGSFALNCVGCHWESPTVSNTDVPYDMTAYEEIVETIARRVIPGDAANSILWRRVAPLPALDPVTGAVIIDAATGQPKYLPLMPIGGVFDPTNPTAKSDIYLWIQSGAKNN